MKYYLIVAPPRSGTTFLSRAMDHAHRTRSVVGDLILPVTCSLHALSRQRGDREFSDAIEHGFESELVRRSGINSRFEAVHRFVTSRQRMVPTACALMRTQAADRFVFKEPFLSVSPTLALTQLTFGVFWILRDGRDVANSLVNSYDVLTNDDLRTCRSNENPVKSDRNVGDLYIPWWVSDLDVDLFAASTPYVRAGMMWAFMTEACHEAFAGDDRVTQTHYEELVSNPQFCQQTIEAFLHVSTTAPLVKACKAASGGSIGAFQRRERSEIQALESAIGSTLERCGYTS